MTARALFPQAIGPDWAHLPEAVRRMHRPVASEGFSGRARVERGDGLVSQLLATLFRFPPEMPDTTVRLGKQRDAQGETWERDFGGSVFRTRLRAGGPGAVRERLGPFEFELGLPLSENGVDVTVRRGWFLGAPLPKPLLPVSRSREFAAVGRCCFDIAVYAPLGFGLIVRYRGWLEPDAESDPELGPAPEPAIKTVGSL